jgi:hypothetical protein
VGCIFFFSKPFFLTSREKKSLDCLVLQVLDQKQFTKMSTQNQFDRYRLVGLFIRGELDQKKTFWHERHGLQTKKIKSMLLHSEKVPQKHRNDT